VPAVRDEGLCLRHWDWSETSQTVSIFAKELGVVRGLAKGARRERGAFSGGIDLLARGEFGAIVKPGLELATLTEWDLVETFPALRESLSRNRVAFYAVDLVQRMLAPADPHRRLYDELVTLLRTLGAWSSSPSMSAWSSWSPWSPMPPSPPSSSSPSTASFPDEPPAAPAHTSATIARSLLRFQWRLLEECGLQPALDLDPGPANEVHWFDPIGGVLGRSPLRQGWRVRRSTIEIIRRQGVPPATTDPSAPIERIEDAEAIDRANRFLAAYLREVMQVEPVTMKDLFGNIGVASIRGTNRSI